MEETGSPIKCTELEAIPKTPLQRLMTHPLRLNTSNLAPAQDQRAPDHPRNDMCEETDSSILSAYDLLERNQQRGRFSDLVAFIERQACILQDHIFGDIQDSMPKRIITKRYHSNRL